MARVSSFLDAHGGTSDREDFGIRGRDLDLAILEEVLEKEAQVEPVVLEEAVLEALAAAGAAAVALVNAEYDVLECVTIVNVKI